MSILFKTTILPRPSKQHHTHSVVARQARKIRAWIHSTKAASVETSTHRAQSGLLPHVRAGAWLQVLVHFHGQVSGHVGGGQVPHRTQGQPDHLWHLEAPRQAKNGRHRNRDRVMVQHAHHLAKSSQTKIRELGTDSSSKSIPTTTTTRGSYAVLRHTPRPVARNWSQANTRLTHTRPHGTRTAKQHNRYLCCGLKVKPDSVNQNRATFAALE